MLRSPFRRARPPPSPPREASARAAALAHRTGLPVGLCEALALALDVEAPRDARARAIARLERAPAKLASVVARALMPALAAPPDVASRAHLALLLLAPDLAVGRDEHGQLCAGPRPLSRVPHDGAAGHVESGLGRVVGLDALAALFGPEEALPAFLGRPATPAPSPYRPAPEILERREREEQDERERQRRRELLSTFGLVEDDLDDDPEERLVPGERHRVARRGAPVVGVLAAPAAVALRSGEQRVELGVAQAGEWWADLRVGDHRGAERWLVRLARDAPSARPRVRRAAPLPPRGGVIVVELGDERLEQVVAGRVLVPFIEHDGEHIVGITLCWSSR